jgi:long-chain acyl-CoA synthetase
MRGNMAEIEVHSDHAYTNDEPTYLAHLHRIQDQSWPVDVPRQPVYPLGERPITEYLGEWARRTPTKTAINFYGRETTYAELDYLSDRFAALLAQLGAVKGDRIAVYLPNCPQFVVRFFGILKAGCIHVPVNPMFTEPELAYELNDTAAKIIVVHDQLLPVLQAVASKTSVAHILRTSLLDALPVEPDAPYPANLTAERRSAPGTIDLMQTLSEMTAPPPEVTIDLDDVAAINYTGGTTGLPKGCEHTQRDMLFTGAVMSSISASVTGEDVVLNFWPIFWVAGEDIGILLPVTTGATCVLLARWDAVACMRAIERHRITVAAMVVDNAVEIMEHPQAGAYNLSSLREVLVASFVKKLNVAFRKGWRDLTGTTLREAAWGMTETHSFDTFTRGFQHGDYDLGAQQVFCGLPVPETDFKILEFGSDRLLPIGTEGELCVRSPSLLKNYWNKPATADDGLINGWLRTGDIGMIGPGGHIHFLGRRKEMLKVKGMSVFPAEIEAVLGQHPAVTGSGVIGRTDDVRGQSPVAFVTLHPQFRTKIGAEDITAFCRERLAVYKIPEIRIAETLPMTATGKVRKEELSKLL